jgi:HD-GYP domain-containing protein (c-di-GMP phosphodiesterase class II)
VPVTWAGEVRAALSASSADPGRRAGPHDVEVLREVGNLGAAAIDHAERRQDLEAALHAGLSTLARAVEMRDPRHPQGGDAVMALAVDVGLEMGLPQDAIDELRLAALLRDVGKLAVPDSVLRKPGPLSAREWDVMKRHPEWGGEMVFGIHGLEGVAAIVVHHHEHYDGGGYPDRLAGEDIPLRSRIVAVCDAYCAMTSDRSYRPALRPIAALRELERRAGTQFDPEAVQALTRAARVSRE